jgi:hypothetical protein
MSETADLTHRLLDHVTKAAFLTKDDWSLFKQQHNMTPEQTEAVLVLTIQHLCSLITDLSRRD